MPGSRLPSPLTPLTITASFSGAEAATDDYGSFLHSVIDAAIFAFSFSFLLLSFRLLRMRQWQWWW